MSPAEIARKMQEIENRCSHWKNCADGSYGLALECAGYNAYMKKLNEMGYTYHNGKAEENDNGV